MYCNRVKIIMEKDALKNPLTSRNATSARLLLGQVHLSLYPCLGEAIITYIMKTVDCDYELHKHILSGE